MVNLQTNIMLFDSNTINGDQVQGVLIYLVATFECCFRKNVNLDTRYEKYAYKTI